MLPHFSDPNISAFPLRIHRKKMRLSPFLTSLFTLLITDPLFPVAAPQREIEQEAEKESFEKLLELVAYVFFFKKITSVRDILLVDGDDANAT